MRENRTENQYCAAGEKWKHLSRIKFPHPPSCSVPGKIPPAAMQETHVQSLGQEDPLEKEMATHSSVLAWRIPWTEEPGGLQALHLSSLVSMGLQRGGHH